MTVGGVTKVNKSYFRETKYANESHTQYWHFRASALLTEKGEPWHIHVYWHRVTSVTDARIVKIYAKAKSNSGGISTRLSTITTVTRLI